LLPARFLPGKNVSDKKKKIFPQILKRESEKDADMVRKRTKKTELTNSNNLNKVMLSFRSRIKNFLMRFGSRNQKYFWYFLHLYRIPYFAF